MSEPWTVDWYHQLQSRAGTKGLKLTTDRKEAQGWFLISKDGEKDHICAMGTLKEVNAFLDGYTHGRDDT